MNSSGYSEMFIERLAPCHSKQNTSVKKHGVVLSQVPVHITLKPFRNSSLGTEVLGHPPYSPSLDYQMFGLHTSSSRLNVVIRLRVVLLITKS